MKYFRKSAKDYLTILRLIKFLEIETVTTFDNSNDIETSFISVKLITNSRYLEILGDEHWRCNDLKTRYEGKPPC